MKYYACLAVAMSSIAVAQNISPWKFAISGDSRNCGDIVMPAIASGVRKSGASFYWHLGDFRAIYAVDEDILPPAQLGLHGRKLNMSGYQANAWPDFIAHQIAPFGDFPVYLIPGNHETIPPVTRAAYLAQFADWLDTPLLREQRFKDDPQDHGLRAYYHWVQGNVDFIALDNASADQFDPAQLSWLRALLQRDETSGNIRTIVVGMHAALPGSIGHSHSMGDWPLGDKSGREVYEALWHTQEATHKRVYVFASHSHFFMENIFQTPDWKGKLLPGWIIGSAGAVRYRLPPETSPAQNAMTDVYGYMVATVGPDGTISTSFKRLTLNDLLYANPNVPETLVHWCWEQNKQ